MGWQKNKKPTIKLVSKMNVCGIMQLPHIRGKRRIGVSTLLF